MEATNNAIVAITKHVYRAYSYMYTRTVRYGVARCVFCVFSRNLPNEQKMALVQKHGFGTQPSAAPPTSPPHSQGCPNSRIVTFCIVIPVHACVPLPHSISPACLAPVATTLRIVMLYSCISLMPQTPSQPHP